MKILCPHCGVKGSADDSYCERKVKCPKCQNIFIVQADMALELAAIPEPALEVAAMPEPPPGPAVETAAQEDGPEQDLGLETTPEVNQEQQWIDDGTAEGSEELDWADVATEIDQQLQEKEEAEALDTGVSEDTLDLFDDLTEVEESPVTEAVASMADEDDASLANDDGDIELEEELSQVLTDDDIGTPVTEDGELEEEPYGLNREECWQCGKEDSAGEPFIAQDGRLYCTDCLPAESEIIQEPVDHSLGDKEHVTDLDVGFDESIFSESYVRMTPYYKFSIAEAIKEAWAKTKGAKGSLWAGSAVMYLVILVMVAAGAFLIPSIGKGMPAIATNLSTLFYNLLVGIVSALFTAGLLYMGIRKVAGDPISWKMVGKGFSSSGSIIIAIILQNIFIMFGFLLLILPGIYLAVGYAMTLPLIVDQGLSPWKAMEKSRKAIHKVWWKVFGLFVVMVLIFNISLVPLGIGLIWTWPMFIILTGVLYSYLFVGGKRAE